MEDNNERQLVLNDKVVFDESRLAERIGDCVRKVVDQSWRDVGPALGVDIRNVVRGELETFAKQKAFELPRTEEELRSVIVQYHTNERRTVEEMHKIKTAADTAKQARDLELDELRAKNESLEEMKTQLEKEIVRLEENLRKRNADVKKLHQIIVDSSQGEEGPLDSEIAAAFADLENRIMLLVKRCYTRLDVRTSPFYDNLSSENKELWLRASFADLLYKHFFAPDRKLFGMDERHERALLDFEQMAESDDRVKTKSLVDWRIATVVITASVDVNPGPWIVPKIAFEIRKEMRHCATAELDVLKKNTIELCRKAHDLALLFRRDRTEYRWDQVPSGVQQRDEVEIIGSAVPAKELKQWRTVRTVFGTVVKGGGPGGKLSEDRILLRKGEILVGPRE